MTDIKRDFLYEFNRGLRDIYSSKPSILSVFENIDNGTLRLAPIELKDADFLNEVNRLIFILKKILFDPYKVVAATQEIVPVSKAQNVDQESIKLTLANPKLWAKKDGQYVPEFAYAIVNKDVFINYENAFICQLIKLLLIRLKKIKANFKTAHNITDNESDIPSEYKEFYIALDVSIRKLSRIGNEKVFLDNSRRVVDMSNIFVTDVMKSDKRYYYCLEFYKRFLKGTGAKKSSVNIDFRVLYHNFALVQIMYYLYKAGYTLNDDSLYIPVSGKMFINPIEFKKGETVINLNRTNFGIDFSVNKKLYHIDFAKSLFDSIDAIEKDCLSKISVINKNSKYDKVYISYLYSKSSLDNGILGIGYTDSFANINKLISNL